MSGLGLHTYWTAACITVCNPVFTAVYQNHHYTTDRMYVGSSIRSCCCHDDDADEDAPCGGGGSGAAFAFSVTCTPALPRMTLCFGGGPDGWRGRFLAGACRSCAARIMACASSSSAWRRFTSSSILDALSSIALLMALAGGGPAGGAAAIGRDETEGGNAPIGFGMGGSMGGTEKSPGGASGRPGGVGPRTFAFGAIFGLTGRRAAMCGKCCAWAPINRLATAEPMRFAT